ncbi:MAG: hypothetical protein AABY43_00435 [Candidatus Omnitrophota bacterium]
MNKLVTFLINKEMTIEASFLLISLCMFYILYLKRRLGKEITKRHLPLVSLKLIDNIKDEKYGFYLLNESDFAIKDINFIDTKAAISDSGFKQILLIKIKNVEFLKPKGEIRLDYEVFDDGGISLPQVTNKIIPHLINESFSVQVGYSTLEGRKLIATLAKKGKLFYLDKVEERKD